MAADELSSENVVGVAGEVREEKRGSYEPKRPHHSIKREPRRTRQVPLPLDDVCFDPGQLYFVAPRDTMKDQLLQREKARPSLSGKVYTSRDSVSVAAKNGAYLSLSSEDPQALSKTIVAVKQVVLRDVARLKELKLPRVEAHIVERKRHWTSAPWFTLDAMVWPCQLTDERRVVSRAPGGSALISKSSNLLPRPSSLTSPATLYIFSENNSSTVTVHTIPPLSIPDIVIESEHRQTSVIPTISDYDAEKAGCRSDKRKVRQLSESEANRLVREELKAFGFWAPPSAFPVLKRKKRVTPRKNGTLREAHNVERKRHLTSAP
ncbi:hypothetical protein JB92DRAFT_3111719 [Gautieria morchelliformis]|nr:hypothetical protein JB92DRAFT_3111719 [Gautieria morchelliformis]